MRLQTKLTVAFAAVALLPIAALTAVARVVVVERYRGEFTEALDRAENHVTDEYHRLQSDVEAATERIANADDRLLSPVLLQLAKERLSTTTWRRRPRSARARPCARSASTSSRSSTSAARCSPPAISPATSARTLPKRWPSARRGRARRAWCATRSSTAAAPVACSRSKPRARCSSTMAIASSRVVVVGGRIVGDAFVKRLDPSARLYAADGTLLAARAGAPPKRWQHRMIQLPGPDGEPAARVEIAVSNDDARPGAR